MSQHVKYYLLGESAVVLELTPPVTLASQQRIWGLADRLIHEPEIREAVPGMNNLTLMLENPLLSGPHILEHLQQWWEKSDALVMEPRDIDISVQYGGEAGPDLGIVAQHTGMSLSQVIECHSSAQYIVYFLGFQPGFSYLGGMPEQLSTPRRAEPRLVVPIGSVGIGGSQTGIYPLATPGGWQLIGRTSLALFNPHEMPPTLLRPGDNVRFVPVSEVSC